MTDSSAILIVGAGRMGRGIAQCYALAGQSVTLVDLKPRSSDEFTALCDGVVSDIRADLQFSVELGYLDAVSAEATLSQIHIKTAADAAPNSKNLSLVYEALPETLALKKQAFDWINGAVPRDCVVGSTTSTLNVDELAEMIDEPGRFLNAHWLNPAHLMPLVEVAVGSKTHESAFETLRDSLKEIGKVPVRCAASPGYIVPRIQALAMNEAARLVEEGVASAEDIDTAVRVGFGLRFAVLGLLEFIDWGGNDILFHASDHMSRTVDAHRFKAPDVVKDNMQAGRNGLREGKGFYNYEGQDVEAYRRNRLARFLQMIEHAELLPKGLAPAATRANEATTD